LQAKYLVANVSSSASRGKKSGHCKRTMLAHLKHDSTVHYRTFKTTVICIEAHVLRLTYLSRSNACM